MKGKVTAESVMPVLREAFSKDISVKSFEPMKMGMTNDSYVFDIEDGKFIIRLPGPGSEELINRQQEYEVYQLLKGTGITDEVIYFDPITGVKITRFIPQARVCNPFSEKDIAESLSLLKKVHDLRLEVEHFFDPFERLEYYESLLEGRGSKYSDYKELKEKIRRIYQWTLTQPRDIVLAHIDPVADNFLFTPADEITLIDWEYAAMQDRDIDVAMFVVYSLLNKEQIDRVIEIYQAGNRDELQKQKIYGYIAIMGLVWSNWCEFQFKSGQDLGEYALGQYRFAKEFSEYFDQMVSKDNSQ